MWLRPLVVALVGALCFGLTPVSATGAGSQEQALCRLPDAPLRMPTITILYDNTPRRLGQQTAWGFSCLVKGMQKTVLFDAGGDGTRLSANMRKVASAPREVDAVVISHLHRDHLGGLHAVLGKKRHVVAYLPRSFPEPVKDKVRKQGARVVAVSGSAVKVCNDVFSTGEIGTAPPEQALVLRSRQGLVIITGCAHAGIERVVHRAKEKFGSEILLVLGGFHMVNSSKPEIEAVIAGLKKLGVRHVAPCHCTGDAARRLFKKAYGSGFIEVGVGTVIDTDALR